MTSSLIADILAITKDAFQLLAALAALITAGLLVGRRTGPTAGDHPRPNKTRQVNSKRRRGA